MTGNVWGVAAAHGVMGGMRLLAIWVCAKRVKTLMTAWRLSGRGSLWGDASKGMKWLLAPGGPGGFVNASDEDAEMARIAIVVGSAAALLMVGLPWGAGVAAMMDPEKGWAMMKAWMLNDDKGTMAEVLVGSQLDAMKTMAGGMMFAMVSGALGILQTVGALMLLQMAKAKVRLFCQSGISGAEKFALAWEKAEGPTKHELLAMKEAQELEKEVPVGASGKPKKRL